MVFLENPTHRGELTDSLNTFRYEIGSAEGIRTLITLAENELSLLPLDDDAIKIGAVSGQRSPDFFPGRKASFSLDQDRVEYN